MHWCCNLQQRKIAQGGRHGGFTNVTLLSRTGRKHSWNKFGAKLHQRKQFPLGRRICGFEDVAFFEGHIFRHPPHARALCTIPHNEVRILGMLTLCEISAGFILEACLLAFTFMSLSIFANDVMDIMPPSNEICDHDRDEVEIAFCTCFFQVES
jgi:hypothetical protein